MRFNRIREHFGFPAISIDELDTSDSLKQSLRELYGSDDIETIIGLLLEPREDNRVMGPTLNAIVFEQFDRLRRSDRLFYSRNPVLSAWVEHDSFSAMIERNSGVQNLTFSAFTPHSNEKEPESCSESSMLDPLSGMTVIWSIDGSKLIVNISSEFESNLGYVAIGWNELDPRHPMSGADIMYFYFRNGEFGWSNDVGISSPYGLQSKEDAGCTYETKRSVDRLSFEDGVFYVDFTRSVETEGSCDWPILDESVTTIFSRSSSELRAYHGSQPDSRKAFEINWYRGTVVETSCMTFWVRLTHGMLMIAIFLFAYPIAGYTSRYLKSKKLPFGATWIGLHTSLATVGIFTTFSIAATAFSSVDGEEHLRTTHGKFGVSMCSIVLSQFVVGNLIGIIHSFIDLHDQYEKLFAQATKYFHRLSGYAVLFISPYTIYLGYMELLPLDWFIFEQVWFWYMPLILFILHGEYSWYTEHQKDQIEYKGMSQMTFNEFLELCDGGKMLIVIDDTVIDVFNWVHIHPGGNKVIERIIGTDATDEFKNGIHHHSKQAWTKLDDIATARIRSTGKQTTSQIAKLVYRENLAGSDTDSPIDLFIFQIPENVTLGVHMYRIFLISYLGILLRYMKLFSVVGGTNIFRPYTPLPSKIIQMYYKSDERLVGFAIKLYPKGKMSQVLSSVNIGHRLRITGPHEIESSVYSNSFNPLEPKLNKTMPPIEGLTLDLNISIPSVSYPNQKGCSDKYNEVIHHFIPVEIERE